MSKLISFIICISSLSLSAQLYLKNGGIININGGSASNTIFMVLNTPPSVPITTSGTGNGIIMEAEYNRLQYNLGTASTAITVPYMSYLLESFPLTVSPTSSGSGSGNIRFSSKIPATRSTGYDNILYMPSDVTNMHAVPSITDNSAKTIDRFWIIDANNYTTKPSVNLSFTYIDAEWATNGGNSIIEANLRAQRFNSTTDDWEGYSQYVPAGSINITSNVVSNVSVPSADFFRSWTLNDLTVPLPIELLNFEANCINDKILFQWCTASETNNDVFMLEQSENGIDFYTVATVPGAVYSTQKICYEYPYENPFIHSNYYRLCQTDLDGKKSYSNIIYVPSCSVVQDEILITNNGSSSVGLIINYPSDEILNVDVFDELGQVVKRKPLEIKKGYNFTGIDLNVLAHGMYFISISNSGKILKTQKIIISY